MSSGWSPNGESDHVIEISPYADELDERRGLYRPTVGRIYLKGPLA